MNVVISLDDEVGRQRREGIDFPYLWVRGVAPPDVPSFVREHWYPGRCSQARNERLQGAFSAHLTAWERIADLGSPAATILEDDAMLLRDYSASDLPEDTVTLLGGVFRGFGKWHGAKQKAWCRGGCLETLAKFRHGVNEIPMEDGERLRWVMALAYHIPRGMARKLVDAVRSTQGKQLRCPDVWLQPFVTHFMWPPPFVDRGLPSQCMTVQGGNSDMYCDGVILKRFRRARQTA